jgi:hypothetical protein
MTHGVSIGKAEQHEHSDQHGQRELVVVRESAQTDKTKTMAGRPRRRSRLRLVSTSHPKNATMNTNPNIKTTLIGSLTTTRRASAAMPTDPISATSAASCARRCLRPELGPHGRTASAAQAKTYAAPARINADRLLEPGLPADR